MKKVISTVLVLLLFAFLINAQEKVVSSSTPKFDPAADPFKDVQTAVVDAQKLNKRILLDCGGEWCIWCHRLDEFIEANKEIKEMLHENFIVVKVNDSKENKNEKFFQQYEKVKGYPHFFVLEKDGKFLHSQDTSLLESGKGYDKEKLLAFLKEWSIKKD